MESSNPIIDNINKAEDELRAKESFRYPFRVTCVYLDEDHKDFDIIKEVRDYCYENNINFSAREYCVSKFEEDREIYRLPAFHMYNKLKFCDDIYYFDTNPIYQIQKYTWNYQDELKKKERAAKKRKERYNNTLKLLKDVFSAEFYKKKPNLNIDTSLSKKSSSTI